MSRPGLKRNALVAALLLAAAALAVIFLVPGTGFQPFGGTACTAVHDCGNTVRLAHADPNITVGYVATQADLAAHPPLDRALHAFSNPGSDAHAELTGTGEMDYGLTDADAENIRSFIAKLDNGTFEYDSQAYSIALYTQ